MFAIQSFPQNATVLVNPKGADYDQIIAAFVLQQVRPDLTFHIPKVKFGAVRRLADKLGLIYSNKFPQSWDCTIGCVDGEKPYLDNHNGNVGCCEQLIPLMGEGEKPSFETRLLYAGVVLETNGETQHRLASEFVLEFAKEEAEKVSSFTEVAAEKAEQVGNYVITNLPVTQEDCDVPSIGAALLTLKPEGIALIRLADGKVSVRHTDKSNAHETVRKELEDVAKKHISVGRDGTCFGKQSFGGSCTLPLSFDELKAEITKIQWETLTI